MASTKLSYQPTPAAIRRACQAIQAGWNRRERERRAPYLRPKLWTVPQLELTDLPPGEDFPRDWE